jgi:DHA2 family multidrug resistance protein-like MFS transporter
VLGSLGAAVYRSEIAIPDGVPPAAREAARDTAGGGAAVGEELPLQVASELLEAVRFAFTEALQAAALGSAVLAAGAAAVAYLLLRRESAPA